MAAQRELGVDRFVEVRDNPVPPLAKQCAFRHYGKESIVTVKIALCQTCRRDVHVAEGEPLTCPVCSSPLVETTATASLAVIAPGPEIFLG